jgi:hypothetical protein
MGSPNGFYGYLERFEKNIIIAGAQAGVLGKVEMVPVRPGKLSARPFGRLLGRYVKSDFPAVVDYYGYMKATLGFMTLVEKMTKIDNSQVKSLDMIVVHFASIRIEKVAALDKSLVSDFPWFKSELLRSRGFIS